MKLETIKRNNKKKIIIGSMVVLSVVGCLTLTATRAKYKTIQSLKIANGTVDYIAPDLKLAIKVSEDGETYISQADIPTGNYTLNIEKSKCRIPDSSLNGENAPVDESIAIEYVDGKLNFRGLTKNNTKCYIYFDKKLTTPLEDMLAKLNVQNIKEGIPDFTQVATGAETEANNGIFVTDDPMYGENAKTYYWRGAATTNHVIFDNKCWRIVRINGDGSIRLIYNGEVQSGNACLGGINGGAVIMGLTNEERRYATIAEKYDNASYVGWTYILDTQRATSGTDSNAKTQTEKWYSDNISSVAKLKVDSSGKFCNDRGVGAKYPSWSGTWATVWDASETQIAYAGVDRLLNRQIPTLSCTSDDIYVLSVGAIAADEVMFAGSDGFSSNTLYYLHVGVSYWTMSPFRWSANSAQMFVVYGDNGYLTSDAVHSINYSIRPVINLRSDVTFNEGADGTQNNPYIVQ